MILITWKIFQTEAWSGLYDPVEVVLKVPAGAGTPDATFWCSIIHDVTTMLIKLHIVLHHLKNLPNRSLIWSAWSCWGSSGSPCGCRNSRHYLLVFHNSWCHHHAHFVQAHRSTPFLHKIRSRGGHQGCEPTHVPESGLWLAYFRST